MFLVIGDIEKYMLPYDFNKKKVKYIYGALMRTIWNGLGPWRGGMRMRKSMVMIS